MGATVSSDGSKAGLSEQATQLRLRVGGRLSQGLYSVSLRYGLQRNLSVAFEPTPAQLPIQVRPLVDSDLNSLLRLGVEPTTARDQLEIAWRRGFVDKGASGGLVAVDARDQSPCFVGWLLGPSDNDFIARVGGFPKLGADEALLENIYTPAKYRGLGVMSAAVAQIAERAAEFGARYVLAFVDQHNRASLKGFQRAGFSPHVLHRRKQFGFGLIKKDQFEVLPQHDPMRMVRF